VERIVDVNMPPVGEFIGEPALRRPGDRTRLRTAARSSGPETPR
jgi:hypothetical protein